MHFLLRAAAAAPDDIRRKIRDVLSRPEYDLTPPSTQGESLLAILLRILEWVLRPFRWLGERLWEIHPALYWLMIAVLVGLLLFFLVHIVWMVARAVRRHADHKPWDEADRLSRLTDPSQLESEALALAARSDYIGGVRLLFKACVRRIELAEKRPFRGGITNREILRRYLKQSWGGDLATLVQTIDFKWYGDEPCLAADFEACRRAHANVSRGSGALVRA